MYETHRKKLCAVILFCLFFTVYFIGCGGGSDLFTVGNPVFNPHGGEFTDHVDVVISCPEPGAEIRYTIDGSTPSRTHGEIYSNPIRLTETTTVRAIACKDGMNDSGVVHANFIRTEEGKVALPIFDPPGQSFEDSIDVAVSCVTSGATIRYTIDGSTPSPTHGQIYSNPIRLTQTATIRAIAYKEGLIDSEVASARYGRSSLTIDCGDGVTMELVLIPAGTYMKGTESTDYEWLSRSRPVQEVAIGYDFYMGKYEVTQAQYLAVTGTNPSYFTGDPNLPVEQVSWHDAVAFCEALSARVGYTIRLPSEAEWEYACKAGGGDTRYHFGNDLNQLTNYDWFMWNSSDSTQPVGQKLPNAFGLYDMHGNVREWCQDIWNEDLTGIPTDGSARTTGDVHNRRVIRAGSWLNGLAYCRSVDRNGLTPTIRIYNNGFRVVLDY